MTGHITGRNLVASYPAPGGGILPALGPVSFDVAPGEFVCLLGPSGCGKSTLIRILGGLQLPSQGQAFLDGSLITQPSPQVALMFQESNLMPWRTVLQNIALPLELKGVEKVERMEAARHLLPGLGLGAEFADAYPGELSGGMAQRVALGRVLIQRPEVLLLDEPFGALDALTREQITLDLMQVWAAEQQTVIMVTHNINEAILLADRILVFSQRPGRIIANIPVTLPRPRRIDDSYSDAFGQVAQQVRAAVRQAHPVMG